MSNINYPVPPSHQTFQFGNVVIDSNFDSGNCSQAEKVSQTQYNIWIGKDHPQNQYRTWFYFSIKGFNKGTTVTFNIKNMQNQSKLLNEGLVPVYRQQSSADWKRIAHKVNTAGISYNEGWIQWQFKHTMTSDEKVFLAFFYPWSNQDNDEFLKKIQQKLKERPLIYFQRTSIIKSFEGRPIDFLTISSKKGISAKEQKVEDGLLFPNAKKPKAFENKKGIVIGARVHPGQVPGSHVMTGIIKYLAQDDIITRLLLDRFVFYIFPIFNPDGVARGHYRADPNGINLNRYYISPSPKLHSPIYAVKKWIMHLHQNDRFFAFLDLHAHAGRKGTFIYGNATNQLNKQIDACIFPKILSMNSRDFEYQGSNFTEKNMYCKDRADKISKQGAGRVAIFKATKNAYTWTLQCNYNMSKVHNILQPRKQYEIQIQRPTSTNLDKKLIVQYKQPQRKQASGFFTIELFHQLGQEICESFLDLVEANPISRIDNPSNYFKSVQNLKMNLGVALMRMAPNRFESQFKKIFYGLISDNQQQNARCVKALYLLTVKKAKIQNINAFIKDNDQSGVILPKQQKKVIESRRSVSLAESKNPVPTRKSIRISKVNAKNSFQALQNWAQKQAKQAKYDNSDSESQKSLQQIKINLTAKQQRIEQSIIQNQLQTIEKSLGKSTFVLEKKINVNKVILQIADFKMIGIQSIKNTGKSSSVSKNLLKQNNVRFRFQELPSVHTNMVKFKSPIGIANIIKDPILKKGLSAKQYISGVL